MFPRSNGCGRRPSAVGLPATARVGLVQSRRTASSAPQPTRRRCHLQAQLPSTPFAGPVNRVCDNRKNGHASEASVAGESIRGEGDRWCRSRHAATAECLRVVIRPTTGDRGHTEPLPHLTRWLACHSRNFSRHLCGDRATHLCWLPAGTGGTLARRLLWGKRIRELRRVTPALLAGAWLLPTPAS